MYHNKYGFKIYVVSTFSTKYVFNIYANLLFYITGVTNKLLKEQSEVKNPHKIQII